MQPFSSQLPSTLAPSVHNFVSQTSNNVHEAWAKGVAFGFRDCHIWYGLDLKELRTPKTDTYKHPSKKDCYVRISQQTARKSATARKRLEEAFSHDFVKARKVKYSPDAVINPFLTYDNFIHQAAQLIPPGRTIPECIFGSFAQDQKGWPRDHAEVRKSLTWLVEKLTACRNQKSLILLMATWVELSSVMAIQRLGCGSLRGKAYFDWSEVFAYVRNPDLLSSAISSPAPSINSEQATSSESESSSSEADTPPGFSATKKAATKETATEVTVVIAPATLLSMQKSGARSLNDQSVPDKEKVPSKTKSGRPIKHKTGLEVEFPPPKKRGKLMLKRA